MNTSKWYSKTWSPSKKKHVPKWVVYRDNTPTEIAFCGCGCPRTLNDLQVERILNAFERQKAKKVKK